MKKVYVTGIAGTGKTTIYEQLKIKGYTAISIDETDNLCSWVNKETKEKVTEKVELNRDFTSKHKWLCNVDYLKKLLDVKEDIIFVLGITSNQDEFLYLFNKILLLQCKPEVFIERLKNRTNNDFGKDKTVQDHMLTWYKDFENELIERGAIPINVDIPINEVVDEVIKQALS